jgi:hypothetical protein
MIAEGPRYFPEFAFALHFEVNHICPSHKRRGRLRQVQVSLKDVHQRRAEAVVMPRAKVPGTLRGGRASAVGSLAFPSGFLWMTAMATRKHPFAAPSRCDHAQRGNNRTACGQALLTLRRPPGTRRRKPCRAESGVDPCIVYHRVVHLPTDFWLLHDRELSGRVAARFLHRG